MMLVTGKGTLMTVTEDLHFHLHPCFVFFLSSFPSFPFPLQTPKFFTFQPSSSIPTSQNFIFLTHYPSTILQTFCICVICIMFFCLKKTMYICVYSIYIYTYNSNVKTERWKGINTLYWWLRVIG